MAYDEDLAHRIRELLASERHVEKAMFGGLVREHVEPMVMACPASSARLRSHSPGMRPTMVATPDMVRRLISVAGETYAEQSGIRLRDKPKPLFQLLTLAMLVSKPIGADTAAAAARQLFKAGLRTPSAVIAGDRATMIAAFGQAGYARYDESSATRLHDMAVRVRDEFDGDLRNLAIRCGQDPARAMAELQRFKGIGPTGAAVFMREVQVVWAWAQPFFDSRALAAAGEVGLPTSAHELGELAPNRSAELAAALVRVSLNPKLRDQLTSSHCD